MTHHNVITAAIQQIITLIIIMIQTVINLRFINIQLKGDLTMRIFFNREWSFAEKRLLILSSFLLGCLLGFLFAPIKKGVYCGNHNGNTWIPERDTKEV